MTATIFLRSTTKQEPLLLSEERQGFKDYFELMYMLGYLELLGISGFFGSVDGESFFPFLGSSIQELPVAVKEAYKQFQQVQYLTPGFRSHTLEFYSKKYDDQGFAPANPLCFSGRHIMHTAASFVF
ncbi:hypothetical protein CU097_004689 [Rhizopus azygosporus]|uniref:Uncharacterized protein n=2 Tax=Rhizopus TaxID=4842 RepID=A0A367J2B4_RHIAZ|nr:hypothetical protein BCV71DRAFT_267451 [Rhizopus microsporus]RCH84072.1 hypothetical protein CU097_004689 [Rhizopus azygosporus]